MISTPSGERLVEELQIGDEVLTLSGRKPIKWIGYNKFTKEEGKAWQDSVMPIRVARFAIDGHAPHRDLYLSPGHYVFLNEVLIQVQYLINETTITPRMPSDQPVIEYYHLDLDAHEVIYAEGALVDSYFDDGSNRESFSNFVQYERHYGVERQSKMTPFAPMLGYNNGRRAFKGLVRSVICRRPRSDPNCLRSDCQASDGDARLTVAKSEAASQLVRWSTRRNLQAAAVEPGSFPTAQPTR